MPESSNAGGRKPRVTDADLLDVFRATSDPVLSTAEVADRVPIKRRGVLNRLRDLEGRGALASKQIGGRNTVWWLPDDVDESAPRESREDAESGPAVERDPSPADADPPDTRAESDVVGDTLAGWEPDTQADAKSARAQTRRAVEFLREHAPERFKAGELKDALAGESSFSPRHWRERAVQPGLKHLADAGLVEYTKNKGYRWVGDAGADL